MDEKRVVLRRRTYLAARLSSHDGIALSQGVVRNISAGGALIEASGSPFPDVVEIAVPLAGLNARARVVWRDGPRAGLQFAASAAPPKRTALRFGDDANY